MKLPNPDRAIVDIAKLRTYSLDISHPDGKHKAVVFAAVLGITEKDSEWLQQRLYSIVYNEAQPTGETKYGKRYVIDFELQTAVGKLSSAPRGSFFGKKTFPD